MREGKVTGVRLRGLTVVATVGLLAGMASHALTFECNYFNCHDVTCYTSAVSDPAWPCAKTAWSSCPPGGQPMASPNLHADGNVCNLVTPTVTTLHFKCESCESCDDEDDGVGDMCADCEMKGLVPVHYCQYET